MRGLGFVGEGFDVHYLVAEKVEDILPMLETAASHATISRAHVPVEFEGYAFLLAEWRQCDLKRDRETMRPREIA